LRHRGQSIIFGDQRVSAHNKSCYPQPLRLAIRHFAGFQLALIPPFLL
jgi:hypothetical protein